MPGSGLDRSVDRMIAYAGSVGRPSDGKERVMSRRVLALGYGVLAYLGFLAVFASTVGFLAGESSGAHILLWTLHGAGWVFLLASTFLIGHFDLFGIRQVIPRSGALAVDRRAVAPERAH
jgi:hypothetical protein